jgi:RHS repeat-associated protein
VIEDAGVMDRAYAYDPLGNRIETSERLFEDANGNVVVRDDAQLTYDALNRLISIRVPKQYDKTYTYDGLNRRLSETVTDAKGESTTHRFVYDDRREIGKVDERGALIELRLLGQGIAEDIGAAVAFEFKGVPYAPIHDYRGSVTALVSAQGRPVECYRYTAFGEEQIYNSNGEAITARESVNPWRYSSKRVDATTGLVHFGHRDYDAISGRWLTEDPLGTADGPNRHAFVKNNPLSFVDPQGLFSLSTLWEGVSKQFWHCADYLQDAFGSISNTIENNFRVYDDIADDLRFVMREMIGPLFFTLVGLHNEDVEFGACGNGEFSDQVRVSYINGVLNNREAVMESAMQISECHGGVNVHFTFRPTGGLTRDVYNSLLRLLGYSSPASRRLAEGWRQLIDEMGGVDGRGLILHYAHSLGGAETDCARQLMSPEELQMIRVIAFGCPKVLRNEGFRHVQSYMGALDFVMVFGLFGYVDAMLSRSPHVIFLGHSGLSAWSDHLLNCPIYATKLVELGRRFVAMYDPRRRNDSYELLDYPER